MESKNNVWAAIAIVLVLAVWGISEYNGLVQLREDVRLEYSQIETMLQRRYDLIPNLVETVKGYANHENETFVAIAESRIRLDKAKEEGNVVEMYEESSLIQTEFLALAEAYPELKADTMYIGLMDELAGTENRIRQSRGIYNETVSKYNAKVQTFPTSIFAQVMGFKEADYIKATDGAENAPSVKFD